MGLTKNDAILLLKKWNFNKYYAKSNRESLFIHSFNVFSLIDNLMPYTSIYSDSEKEKMRWAALLHDFGKTTPQWKKELKGGHKVKPGSKEFETVQNILKENLPIYTPTDIDDIMYMIMNHHGVDAETVTSKRQQMAQILSVCDNVVSQNRPLHSLIETLNPIISIDRYRLFSLELIEHPISPFVIGAFDYIYAENGIVPILYSPTATLFIAPVDYQLPAVDDVNAFLNDVLSGKSDVCFKYDNGNTRVYTNGRDYLHMVSNPKLFVEKVKDQVTQILPRLKKSPSFQEEVYLYGRVCGGTYNALKNLCKVSDSEMPQLVLAAGGWHCKATVEDLRLKGYKEQGTFDKSLLKIVNDFQSHIEREILSGASEKEDAANMRYNIKTLMAFDTAINSSGSEFDIKKDAEGDYAKYFESRNNPFSTCPICHKFEQGNASAKQFPASPLGGTVEVFYTGPMGRLKKEGEGGKGVSPCEWCTLWWNMISTNRDDGNRYFYHLCVIPHHAFARLDWREILQPEEGLPLVELGSPDTLGSKITPHIAVLALKGNDRNSFLKDLTGNQNLGENQILDRIFQHGLTSITVVTNPSVSHHLLTCGSIKIDIEEWEFLRLPLRYAKSGHVQVVRALQHHRYAWGKLLANGTIGGDKKVTEKLVNDLTEKTGLLFLKEIKIEGKDRIASAERVIRRMNETLRKLKDSKEDKSVIVDSMVALGLKTVMSTREGRFYGEENQNKEIEALRLIAQKLYEYKDQMAKRSELVRSMSYSMGYLNIPAKTKEKGGKINEVSDSDTAKS